MSYLNILLSTDNDAGQIFLFLLILALPFIVWIWALVDIVRSEFKTGFDKIVWLLMVFFLPVLGFILYIFIGRKQKIGKIPDA